MKRNNRNIVLLFLVLWMLIIFYMSSLPIEQSNSLSQGLESKVNDMINLDEGGLQLNYIIRKVSHILEYMVLSILVFLYLDYYDDKLAKKKIWKIILALIISLAYAILDEYHQTFVVGRLGSLEDVFIDSIGIAIGIILVLSIRNYFKKNKK